MSVSAASVDAVVIGAGIAGLAAALELQAAGREVFVIDPADRPGGAIRTDHVNGYVVERGPNTTRVKAPMREFLVRRRLEDALQAAKPAGKLRQVYRDGSLVPVPTSLWSLIGTPLLSARGKLRLLAEPFVRRHRGDEESVAEFLGRRLGPEVVTGMAGPFLTGVYAGDETQLGARAVFGSLVGFEERGGSIAIGGMRSLLGRRGPRGLQGSYSVNGGLGRLARRLAEQLSEPPALGSRVVAIARRDGGYRVDVTTASSDLSLDARQIVVATQAPEAAQILRGVDSEVARALEEIRYSPIVAVPLGVDPADVATEIEGFGFLVPREAGLGLLGCLFMSRLFPGRAPKGRELLHCMLGGVRWPDAPHQPDDVLLDRAREEIDRTLGLRGEVEPLGVARWVRAVPQPGRDHVARMDWVVRRLAESAPGLALAGAYVAGVALTDALASGVAAAEKVLDAV